MRRIAAFFAAIGDGIARIFWALLGLDSNQQRSLFSWAIVGGMVMLSFGAWHLVDLMVAAKATSGDIADICKLVIGLLALFNMASVLIARGGEMTIKGPGGIEVSARGGAATELGKTSSASDVLASATPPPPPPPPPAPAP